MKAIHHTAISTGNLHQLTEFYRQLLGFEVESEFGWQKGSGVADMITGLEGSSSQAAMLKLGDFRLELFQYTSPEPEKSEKNRPVCDHGITHLAFTVDDINAEYKRLVSLGMTFHCPPQDLGTSRVTYGRDPDGNVVELMQLAAD